MGWDKVGWGAGREMLHYYFFLIPYCYFLMQHGCSPPASKPSGQQKTSKGPERVLENTTGASTDVGGHEEKMSTVSKEAERVDMRCRT